MAIKSLTDIFVPCFGKKGFLVYSIEYRLVPDCMIFDQLRDVFAAMDFIKKRVKLDGGDLSHVYMSETVEVHALLHMLMQFRTATKIAKAAGVKPSDLHVSALGLISGMFYTTKLIRLGFFFLNFYMAKITKRHHFPNM